MILVCRSWPHPDDVDLAELKPHVYDRLERVIVRGHDYTPVRDTTLARSAAGVLHFDWDIAVSLTDLRRMCERARLQPDRGFVAPYPLHRDQRCAHRRWRPEPDDPTPVDKTESDCDLPAFGAIYVPRLLLEGWEPPAHDPRMTDTNFALWARGRGVRWPIMWRTGLVHLHY